MKRLAFIFAFLLCCSAIQVQARGIMTMAGAGVPVAGCGALATARTDGTSGVYVGEDAVYDLQYKSSSFTATATGSIQTVYIYIRDYGTPDTNLYMWLCADSSGSPDSSNGVTAMDKCTQSTTTTIGPPGGTYISAKYKFAGYAVTASSVYHIVVAEATPTIDGTNYYSVQANMAVAGEGTDRSSDGISWGSVDSSSQFNLGVTSCDE